MQQNETEDLILKFMKEKATQGYLQLTAPEIAKGAEITYNEVVKALERLTTKELIGVIERGTSKKSVPYYYLFELEQFSRLKWAKT
jgi:transcription initiation factor IIE alpha subunit